MGGGTAGVWIASMKANWFCMRNTKPSVGAPFRKGSKLTKTALDEAESLSNSITLMAKDQLTTSSLLGHLHSLVSKVARKLCELVDRAASTVRDAIKRNTGGLIDFDTCGAVQGASALISIVLN